MDFRDGNMADSGATGKIATAWDDDHIYVYIEVTDKTPNHDLDTNWQNDNVEFFFDWNNAKYEGTNGDTDGNPFWQVRIHSGNGEGMHGFVITGHANFNWDPDDHFGITHVVVPLSGSDLSNGYIIEAAFPRNAIEGGFTFTEGMTIGFDASVGDSQEGFERDSSAFFYEHDAAVGSNMWENPAALKALLVLGAAPAPAVVEPDEAELGTGGGEEPVAPAPVEAPVTAPPTSDMTAIFVITAVLALGAAVVFRKKAAR
jgi:hypothetical protein